MLAYEVLNLMVAVQQSLRLEYLSDAFVTRDNEKKILKRPYVRTTKHEMLSIRYQLVIHWNILQKHFETTELTSLRQTKVGAMIFFEIISEKKKKKKNIK